MEARLHFIGIGGIGMSAIAKILLHEGFSISGSDVARGRLTEQLEQDGADIFYGHAAENIPADCQAVVYSSAVRSDNPEMQEASRRGLKIYRRAEMLAFLMSLKTSIAVAGAHGKTTTSGMISTMLEQANTDPTVVIGGMLPSIGGSNAKAGDGKFLVAEADESDGTFLLLHPTIAVVTNIEADHLDHYGDMDHIVQAFGEFFRQIPEHGCAVFCNDCPVCRELTAAIPGRYISYALHNNADYTAANIKHISVEVGGGISADVLCHGELLGELQLKVGGEHNIANALSAIAVGMEVGLTFDQCVSGLYAFTGTARRFDKLGQFGNTLIVDDYAHHPTEVKATIAAARAQGVQKLFSVFQPHRYSRTQAMYNDFAEALMDGGRVMLVELYPAFEQPIEGVSARMIVDALIEMGHNDVCYASSVEEGREMLHRMLKDEEMLLVMGAGNVRWISERMVLDGKEIKIL